MKNITKESIQAFMNNEEFSKSNTSIEVSNGVTKLKLHSNTIAVKEFNRVKISNCGWKTKTTKERLNAIPGVHIKQKNFIWYLNGVEWDGKLTEVKELTRL